MENKQALLIIDMQKGLFTATNPRFNADGVVSRINILAEKFRKNNLPVIFIQHDGSKENEFVPYTHDWELLSDLLVEPGDILINKTANDNFYNSNLASKLKEFEVNHLFITGCATDFCVEATIQSALAKDYNITVVSNGHTTADRPHLKAEKVIEHYNWVWQNMIPTKGSIKVIACEQIESLE